MHLEIIAAFLALKCYASSHKNCKILVRVDDTTVISYINRFFQRIIDKRDLPESDIFASRTNTKIRSFYTWRREPEATYIDAFSVNDPSDGEISFPGCKETLRLSYERK